MTTMKDIARELKVSVTTVSRALNDYDDVAQSTKMRIRDLAGALDYHPNAVARSLQNRRANALGLIIPSTFHRTYDAFWLEFIGGVASVCAREGLDLSLSAAGSNTGSRPFERWVRSRRVDGLVVCDVRAEDPRLAYLHRHRVPFVAFGRTTGTLDYSYIDVDGAAGVLQGVNHLLQLGHERIAYLGMDAGLGFSLFRLEGYREAVARAGLPYDPALVLEGLSEVSAKSAVAGMFTLAQPPTAVFAAADFLALAALGAARGARMMVPADLSIVVFDDNLPIQQADPPMTAIGQPNKRLGEESAEMLLDRVANPNRPVMQRLVVPNLVVRSSTDSPSTQRALNSAGHKVAAG